MEINNELHERIQREQRLAARLRLATDRLEEAQQERIWAVAEAHQSGLSIRQIAAATTLSSSRVHQLLGSEESREIPRWLSQRRDREAAPSQDYSDRKILAGWRGRLPCF
jgi:AraC-like DNA-binding protein